MTDAVPSFADWVAAVQTRTETALDRFLPAAAVAPSRLHDAMRYAVLGGGKRVRPLLCHAAGALSGASSAALDAAACAVELIHAYSLVHDDMPCMDDDVLRRGKPTVHVQYDDATALLVGDSLQSLAFLLLSEHCDVAADTRVRMVSQLAIASGSRGMAGGQAIDLASVGIALGVAELEFMHIHKTGALIRCAVRLGAACGQLDVDAQARLDHYAGTVGLLFQVVDDVLDCEASTEALGKTAGKDAAANKPTYVSTLGLARARERARELHAEAIDSLSPFGDEARRLRELADFVLTRKH
ncbi:MAG: polyprenyl synthetase family protein [Methyloversatilis discipulorum]|uniref:polyprenyl synthetase family protein n=1 Tax=Methyloversatilis discipulorum TaxID=1119528 RepID=UPI0026EFB4E2|nr:farnesyl diphosphate synthase [Methyloversatilis discipulorum]MBT9517676.1 polyprenyl synthetase family protein [Methyloversatilis discipulorum]